MQPDQLSNTAAFIGIKFYGLTRDQPYRSLFDDEVLQFYERLVSAFPAPLRFYHSGLKSTVLRRFFTFWEELLLPGDLMHIILRKWYLSRWVEELRKQDYKQMLILGAGFDHLAALNAAKGVQSVELDIPRMIDLKRDFIHQHSYDHPNLTLQQAFFTRDSLQRVLKSKTNLNPSAKTGIIAEGFFDYFTQQASSQLLTDLNTFFTGEHKLLSTIFSLQELSWFRSAVYKNSIKLAGEELKLHLSQPKYISFLEQHGYKVERCMSYKEMENETLAPRNISRPVLPGFYLIEAKNQ